MRVRPSVLAEGRDSSEAFDGFRFVLVNLEDGDELRDMQQLIELGGKVQKLQLKKLLRQPLQRAKRKLKNHLLKKIRNSD